MQERWCMERYMLHHWCRLARNTPQSSTSMEDPTFRLVTIVTLWWVLISLFLLSTATIMFTTHCIDVSPLNLIVTGPTHWHTHSPPIFKILCTYAHEAHTSVRAEATCTCTFHNNPVELLNNTVGGAKIFRRNTALNFVILILYRNCYNFQTLDCSLLQGLSTSSYRRLRSGLLVVMLWWFWTTEVQPTGESSLSLMSRSVYRSKLIPVFIFFDLYFKYPLIIFWQSLPHNQCLCEGQNIWVIDW